MSQVFATSDLHLGGHEKIAEDRGFASTELHDAAVMASLYTIPRGSHLWIFGDLSSGRRTHEDHALSLLYLLSRDKDLTLYLIAGNHDSCVDADTRAVTRRGFVSIDDLRPDDQVLSLDDDRNSVWVTPSRVIRYPHTGTATHIQSQTVDSLTTDDHRIVGIQRTGRGWMDRWVEGRADQVTLSTLGIPTSGAGSVHESSRADQDIRLAAWCLTDSHRREGRWTFYQAEPKKGRLEELLDMTKVNVRSRERDTDVICGKRLRSKPQTSYEYTVADRTENRRLTELVGDRNHLPPWVWDLSERQVDLLVEEWVYTDGTRSTAAKKGRGRGSVVIYCSRTSLRGELMALMAANGWQVSATEYREDQWRINAVKGQLTLARTRTTSEYSGEVWCLTVPFGRFFVERNGKVFLTGNCHGHHGSSHKHADRFAYVFSSVKDEKEHKIGQIRVLLNHLPYNGDSHGDEDRFPQQRPRDLGLPVIHGHVHGRYGEAVTYSDQGTLQVHVGWDSWRRPVSFEEIHALLTQHRRQR